MDKVLKRHVTIEIRTSVQFEIFCQVTYALNLGKHGWFDNPFTSCLCRLVFCRSTSVQSSYTSNVNIDQDLRIRSKIIKGKTDPEEKDEEKS